MKRGSNFPLQPSSPRVRIFFRVWKNQLKLCLRSFETLVSREIARFKDILGCFSYLFVILLHFALTLECDQSPNECPPGSALSIFLQIKLSHKFEGESLNDSAWKGPLAIIGSNLRLLKALSG